MKITFDKQDEKAMKDFPRTIHQLASLAMAFLNTFMFGAVFYAIATISAYDVQSVRIGLVAMTVLFINIVTFITLAVKKEIRRR
jgi:hypothetical protein